MEISVYGGQTRTYLGATIFEYGGGWIVYDESAGKLRNVSPPPPSFPPPENPPLPVNSSYTWEYVEQRTVTESRTLLPLFQYQSYMHGSWRPFSSGEYQGEIFCYEPLYWLSFEERMAFLEKYGQVDFWMAFIIDEAEYADIYRKAYRVGGAIVPIAAALTTIGFFSLCGGVAPPAGRRHRRKS